MDKVSARTYEIFKNGSAPSSWRYDRSLRKAKSELYQRLNIA